MSKLIDADVLRRELIKGHDLIGAKYVDLAPDIDAVEVVRCKDCKYKNSDIYKNAYTCDRFKGNVFVVDDDYCSYAEGRNDED